LFRLLVPKEKIIVYLTIQKFELSLAAILFSISNFVPIGETKLQPEAFKWLNPKKNPS
jgi:hypothetical protein